MTISTYDALAMQNNTSSLAANMKRVRKMLASRPGLLRNKLTTRAPFLWSKVSDFSELYETTRAVFNDIATNSRARNHKIFVNESYCVTIRKGLDNFEKQGIDKLLTQSDMTKAFGKAGEVFYIIAIDELSAQERLVYILSDIYNNRRGVEVAIPSIDLYMRIEKIEGYTIVATHGVHKNTLPSFSLSGPMCDFEGDKITGVFGENGQKAEFSIRSEKTRDKYNLDQVLMTDLGLNHPKASPVGVSPMDSIEGRERTMTENILRHNYGFTGRAVVSDVKIGMDDGGELHLSLKQLTDGGLGLKKTLAAQGISSEDIRLALVKAVEQQVKDTHRATGWPVLEDIEMQHNRIASHYDRQAVSNNPQPTYHKIGMGAFDNSLLPTPPMLPSGLRVEREQMMGSHVKQALSPEVVESHFANNPQLRGGCTEIDPSIFEKPIMKGFAEDLEISEYMARKNAFLSGYVMPIEDPQFDEDLDILMGMDGGESSLHIDTDGLDVPGHEYAAPRMTMMGVAEPKVAVSSYDSLARANNPKKQYTLKEEYQFPGNDK